MDKICCFFVHRDAILNKEDNDNLLKIIENLIINKKINNFYFGGYSNFDKICYYNVKKLKIKYK